MENKKLKMENYYQNPICYEEDEIDLRELFKIIVKYKKFISVFVVVVTFLAGVYAFLVTPIYQVKGLLEIGSYKSSLLDNPQSLKTKLDVIFIKQEENIENKKNWIETISIPKHSKEFLEIVSEGFSNQLAKDKLNQVVKYIQDKHKEIIDDIKKGFLDIGFVTKKNIEVNLAKWKEDELVVFSNKPLPRVLELDDLREYKIICREENSSTREFIREQFDRFNLNCDDLNVVSIVHNSTALKYTILNSNEQFVSIISKVVIEEKLKTKRLYFSKLKGVSLKRKIYIAYKDESSEIQALINFLKN